MPVILTVHGGASALADVMEGLVERNVRALKGGAAPFASAVQLPSDGNRMWRDAPTAMADGVASAGTIAAWRAAEERVKAESLGVAGLHAPRARVALVNGVPSTVLVEESGLVRVIPPTSGFAQPMSVGAFDAGAFGLSGEIRDYQEDEGPVQEQMWLTLDDDYALPVREVNTAIARHNAHRIRKKGLPLLYQSGVVYKTEGTPELWWDAEEILRNGHDDCEGLAAFRAGELLAGADPSDYTGGPLEADVFTRYIPTPGGVGRLFHAITRVKVPDDSVAGWSPKFDDPSVRLGMPCPKWYKDFLRRARAEGREG